MITRGLRELLYGWCLSRSSLVIVAELMYDEHCDGRLDEYADDAACGADAPPDYATSCVE